MTQDSVNQDFDGLLDLARLQAWADAHLPGRGPLSLTKIHAGASNVMFRLDRDGKTYALRRPPSVANDPTSNNLLREIRLLQALGRTNVPHPRLAVFHPDTDVMGVPFFLAEWIDGFTPMGSFPEPHASNAAVRRQMGFEMIDALAEVAAVDWKAVGLEGFGKPDGFLQRQVARWLGQLDRYRSREIPHLKDVAEWLTAHTPQTPRVGLIHGDYSFANVMFSRAAPPAKLAAIVDWESATIGDPLLDLGHLLSGWRDDPNENTWATFVTWGNGFASRKELAARYAERTGLPVTHLNFYMALAVFKLGVIMEGAYYRYATGRSTHEGHRAMEQAVPAMLKQAAELTAAS